MSYFGLSSSEAVLELFNSSSSSTYNLLHASSEYISYKTINSVVTSLRSQIATSSDNGMKSGLQDRLDTILESIKDNSPVTSESGSFTEVAKTQSNLLLPGLGLGKNINTIV